MTVRVTFCTWLEGHAALYDAPDRTLTVNADWWQSSSPLERFRTLAQIEDLLAEEPRWWARLRRREPWPPRRRAPGPASPAS